MEIINACITEVIVAILTAIFVFLFQKYIKPFALGIIQSAPNIAGVWDGADINELGEECLNSKMTIKQIGSRIDASIIRRSSNGREREFNYKGTISAGQVVLIWKEKESNGYNMGTLTLILSGNLQVLKGKTTYYHKDIGKVISKEKIYRIKKK